MMEVAIFDPWCKWHIETVENPRGTDCSAHMHEARCFGCPFPTYEDAKAGEYPCVDAKLKEETDGS